MLHRKKYTPVLLRLLAAALALLCCLFLCTEVTGYAVTQSEINALKDHASDLRTQKDALQGKLNALSHSQQEALARKGLLEQKINVIQEEIQVSQTAIAQYTRRIEEKEVELQEAEAKQQEYYELFCKRVRTMEESGTLSYWSVLFQANSFSDLLDRVNMVSEIMEYDNQVIDELKAAKQAVAQAKADLESSKADQEATQADLLTQQSELTFQQSQVNELIAEINANTSRYAGQITDLEQNEDQIADQISNAEATYARQLEAQREAARKAAAQKAAAQKAAQEAARKSAANDTGSTASPGTVSSGTGGFLWPVPSSHNVTSGFGYRIHPITGRHHLHTGIDIAASCGASIVASKEGVVIISGYGSSYGNYVALAHADGTRTLYAHMSARAVSAGNTVSQGQNIGSVGSTGSSTGNHCHFEVWTGSSSSTRVNPLNYF